jgi:hypothetical protein
MRNLQYLIKGAILAGLVGLTSACIVAEPRESYYDHEHGRYYHEHEWHECHGRDDICR